MTDARSVSAPDATLDPETVWQLRMPQFRFGRNATDELPAQLDELDVDPPSQGLIVTDENIVDLGVAGRVAASLEDAGHDVHIYDDAEREPSIESVERCIEFVREELPELDFYIGLGGGSCMDTAKTTRAIIANGGEVLDYIAEPTGEGEPVEERGPPLVLMPTTAGTGAETSPNAILSVEEKQIKEAISSDVIRADAAVLDPALTVTLPPDTTAFTGMDALGQAIEGHTTHRFDQLRRPEDPRNRPVYAGRTPVTEIFGRRAIKLLSNNIRQAVHNPDDLEARSAMLRGALFGAIAGLTAGANLCHAMAYPVGNRYHTYHGETIAVLTPASTLGHNVGAKPERFAEVAELLGADTSGMSTREAAERAREEFVQLQRDLDVVPSGLAELAGVDEDEIDWLATQTVETQKRLLRPNPRMVDEDDAREIFRDALYNW